MRKVIVGIIGCGVISNTYIRDLKRLYSDLLEIKAVADIDKERAQKSAEEYQIPVGCLVDELLADPEIELVVDLTPPAMHVELNKKILNAGKHCFTEKPFALSLKDAQEVVDLAKAKGLKLASAPDSFLGSSLSTCRKLLKDNWIGKPLYATLNMITAGVETWHPIPENYYKVGGGPVYDMGGYYFTALVSMFGSVERLFAYGGKGFEERQVYTQQRFGTKFSVDVPTHYTVVLMMKNGMIVNANFSFDIFKTSLPNFEVYGTDGTLFVPDPNMHGGVPKVYRKEQFLAPCFGGNDTGEGEAFKIPELAQDIGEYVRCLGVADICEAILEDRDPVCEGDLALHVIDIMTGIMKSAETGEEYRLVTSYDKLYKG